MPIDPFACQMMESFNRLSTADPLAAREQHCILMMESERGRRGATRNASAWGVTKLTLL